MVWIAESVRSAWRHFHPQHQLLVAIMGWPLLYYLKEGEGVFQWSLLVQYVLLAYLLLLASRQGEGWNGLRSGRLTCVWVLFWCFVLYMTLATMINSPIFLNGVVGYIKHMQFVPLLLVGSAIGLRVDVLRRWCVPYVWVLMILLALPLVLSAIGIDVLSPRVFYVGPGVARPGGYVRYRFGFVGPNQFAVFLASVMVFCLFLSVSQWRRVRVAIPAVAILLLGSYLVYLSQSRRVWLILPVVLVLGIALQPDLRTRAWLVLGIGLLFLCVRYFFWDPIVERLSKILLFADGISSIPQSGPLHTRLMFWDRVTAYLQVPLQWAFGLGAGTIGYAVRQYFASGYMTVDGYYAILLGEYGVIGLALYCALVLAVLVKLVGSVLGRRLAPEHEGAVVASVVGSLVILLAGGIGNSNTTFPGAIYLWTFLGIGLALSMKPEEVLQRGEAV